MKKKTCSHRSWDLTGIPCIFAIQSIYYIKEKKRKKKPEEFVYESYHKKTLKNIYSYFVKSVNDSPLWPRIRFEHLLRPQIQTPA